MYLYSNITGTFVFNQNFEIREKILFREPELKKNFLAMEKGEVLDTEKKFEEKFKSIINLRKDPDEKSLVKVFERLAEFNPAMYQNNLFLTRQQIRDSVTQDQLIIQAASSVEELNKSINLLSKRMREWYSYELPEVEDKIEDHNHLAELITRKAKQDLVREFDIKNSMGADFAKHDADAISGFAKVIQELVLEKEKKEHYLELQMKKECPNITEVAGYLIGAKLLTIAGSLRSLVMMPSSTIQLLGAEKALFRHMINKSSKPPKHGLIHEHIILQRAKREDRGKVARALADKILLAAKIDYFKGEFIGTKLRAELEAKFR